MITTYELNDIEAHIIEKHRSQERKKKLAEEIIFFSALLFEKWMERNKEEGDFSWSNFVNDYDYWGIPKNLTGKEKLLFKLIDDYRTKAVDTVNKIIITH